MNWIEVNGTSLRYELSGSGKTTLVLVHEMGGTLDSWDQVLPALNNSRQVLRYDTRGAGLSEKIHAKITFDDMADDLAALLDALGIEGKVALAGTAVGGAIAIHFAVRHAARAGPLLHRLCDACGSRQDGEERRRDAWVVAVQRRARQVVADDELRLVVDIGVAVHRERG